jgi:hypothetical protein
MGARWLNASKWLGASLLWIGLGAVQAPGQFQAPAPPAVPGDIEPSPVNGSGPAWQFLIQDGSDTGVTAEIPSQTSEPSPATTSNQGPSWRGEQDQAGGTQGDQPATTKKKQQEGQDASEESAQSKKQQDEEQKKKKQEAEKKKKKQADLKKAAAGAYKGVFYDNDFRYVLDPEYQGHELGDVLERQPLGSHTTLDLGGQYRFRLHDEQNFRGLGLTGLDDDFLLQRTRLFANLEFTERMRVFAEFLDAVSQHEELAPRLVEENRATMQNLFVDAVLLDHDLGKLTARAGRQELLLGTSA